MAGVGGGTPQHNQGNPRTPNPPIGGGTHIQPPPPPFGVGVGALHPPPPQGGVALIPPPYGEAPIG